MTGLFEQLRHAIFRDSAEQEEEEEEEEDDVRPTCSTFLHGASDCLSNPTSIISTVVYTHDANTFPHQTDNATAVTVSRGLPALPFTRAASPSRTVPLPERIDLTSPPRQTPVERRRKLRADADLPRPPLKNHKSAEEKRLIADFGVPADRVYVPDPALYLPTTRPAMGKPAASQGSFHPINTLGGSNGGSSRNKNVYGKPFRQSAYVPRISQVLGHGQLAYLEHSQKKSPNAPAKNSPSRQEHFYLSGVVSPSKRRKTGHASPTNVIDFTDEQDVQEVREELEVQGEEEVSPHNNAATPRVHRHDAPRSTHSSQSRRSIDGGHNLARKPSAFSVMSESKIVSDLVNQSKARSRQQNRDAHRKSSCGRSASSSITTHTQDDPIQIPDDEPAASMQPTKVSIFDGFEQGVSSGPSKQRKAGNKRQDVKSHHFSNARINESTADDGEQAANIRQTIRSRSNLRQYRPAQYRTTERDPISEDELAIDPLPKKSTSVKLQASPSKPSQTGAAKRKANNKDDHLGWSLIFARTDKLQAQGEPMPGSRYGRDLILRQRSDGWAIVMYDHDTGNWESKQFIRNKDVNNVEADDVGRIRLMGPRTQDGNRSVIDLEFFSTSDLRVFRDNYASAMAAPSKVVPKDESYMNTLFGKELHKNTKVGTSPLVNDILPEASDYQQKVNKSSKTPLWDDMRANSQHSNTLPNTNGTVCTTAPSGSVGSSLRSTRSTRSAAPNHGLEEVFPETAVEKYSVIHGLGRSWLTPLTYGNGRQKSVVNFGDLSRLDEEEMLNDSLIDFYVIWLFEKYQVPQDKVYFFNTYFYSKLTENTGRSSMNYKAVERWTAKMDIFSYDYIVVPINEATHWYLAIICNVGNIDQKPVQEDFGENAVEDLTNEESRQSGPDESTKSQQPATPSTSTAPKEELHQEDSDDVNLFEEDSINLINRDETGPDDEREDVIYEPSAPQSPAGTVCTTHVVSDQEAVPLTVLSNLSALSQKKKKTKRKPPVAKRDPSQPIIIVLDSLAGPHSNAVRSLKDWLAAEGREKRGMEAVIKENGFYPKGDQIPTQSNWSDCGVYVLGYVEKFFQDPDEFKRKLLTGEMTSEDDWPELKPTEMRASLRNILMELAKEQQLSVPKRRNGKKGAAAAKQVQLPPGASPAKLISQVLSDHQTTTVSPVDTNTEPAKTLVDEVKPVVEESQRHNELPRLRLQSPIEFKPRTQSRVLGVKSPKEKSPEFVVGKVSDSPPVSISPEKPTSMSPQKQTPRKTNPEIRIPAKSPVSQQLTQWGNHVEVTSTSTDGSYKARDTCSTSPAKPFRQPVDEGEELRTPASRKKARPISAETQRRSVETSPPLHDQRDGSSDHPIEIMDSQDMKVKTVETPGGFRTGSPAKRKPPARSPKKSQSLRHTQSVEEVAPPPARDALRKGREPEAAVGYQLEAQLDAADKAVEHVSQLATPLAPPDVFERVEEYDSDPMEIDSQGGCPMDYADDTIRETPEAARRSPSWSASHPLCL